MTQIFEPGQKVYLLFWRRPEDDKFDRVQIYTTKRRRDAGNVDLLAWGMITLTAEWVIPMPFTSALQETSLIPKCPKCGAPMEKLHYGPDNDEWVCTKNCDSSMDEVLRRANAKAQQELGD